MKKFHVKSGDAIKVLSGKWKGEEGKVIAVLKDKDRVVLELSGLSAEKKKQIGLRTVKKTQENQQGGLVERSVSVHVSNVKLQDKTQKKVNA